MTDPMTSVVIYDPLTATPELAAVAGFLAGYGARTDRHGRTGVCAGA